MFVLTRGDQSSIWVPQVAQAASWPGKQETGEETGREAESKAAN